MSIPFVERRHDCGLAREQPIDQTRVQFLVEIGAAVLHDNDLIIRVGGMPPIIDPCFAREGPLRGGTLAYAREGPASPEGSQHV